MVTQNVTATLYLSSNTKFEEKAIEKLFQEKVDEYYKTNHMEDQQDEWTLDITYDGYSESDGVHVYTGELSIENNSLNFIPGYKGDYYNPPEPSEIENMFDEEMVYDMLIDIFRNMKGIEMDECEDLNVEDEESIWEDKAVEDFWRDY